MATFYGTNTTKRRTTPTTLIENSDKGIVKAEVDSFSLTGANVTNNDLVQVGTIPAGARLMPGSYIDFGAFGTSGTVTVGDSTTANKFATTADVSSAARVTLSAAGDYTAGTSDVPVYVKITNKGNATTLTGVAYLHYLF